MRICAWAALSALLVTGLATAEDWPGWRGPAGTGISAEHNLPVHWSAAKNVRWKAKLEGVGASAPITWGERIFLTASDGRLNDRLHVLCYHRNDGRLLWHTRLFGTAATDLYAPGGMAVPTAATDGKNVYALFGTGDVACLDFEGKPVWIRSLAQEYGAFQNRWGMATSPIIVDDMLIIQVDHWARSYLLAVDTTTGANRWKSERDMGVSWTTPLVAKATGRTQLIAFGSYRAIGYDAMTGSPLWSVRGLDLQCIPSPVAQGDLLIAAAVKQTMGIRLDGKSGDLTDSNVIWSNVKASAYIASPLVYGNYAYVPGNHGIVSCLNASNGKPVWRQRIGEAHFASPVAGAGMVYFTTQEGAVHVVRAGPRFEPVSRNDLGEVIVASPAVSTGQIFLRSDKHLFCIENKR